MSGPRSLDDPLRGRWIPLVPLFVFVVLFLGVILGNLLAAQSLGERWAPVGSSLGFVLASFVGLRLVHLQDPNGLRAIGLDEPQRGVRRGLLFVVPFFVLVFALQIVLGLVLLYFGVELAQQGALEIFTDEGAPIGLQVGLALVAVVFAPIAEEVLFRGLIHDALRRRMAFVPAAALGSLLFGMLHIESAATSYFVIPLAVLGFLLCWLRERGRWRRGGGNLWSCIVVHSVYNGITLVIALAAAGQPELVGK